MIYGAGKLFEEIIKNYDLSAYSFDEKLEVLNKRLASELQAERLKHAQSLNK